MGLTKGPSWANVTFRTPFPVRYDPEEYRVPLTSIVISRPFLHVYFKMDQTTRKLFMERRDEVLNLNFKSLYCF